MPQATAPTPVPAAGNCKPWCTDHANGTPPNQWPLVEDQLCRTTIPTPVGEISITDCLDEGTTVHLHAILDEMAPAVVEQFAFALLAAVAMTRTGGAW